MEIRLVDRLFRQINVIDTWLQPKEIGVGGQAAGAAECRPAASPPDFTVCAPGAGADAAKLRVLRANLAAIAAELEDVEGAQPDSSLSAVLETMAEAFGRFGAEGVVFEREAVIAWIAMLTEAAADAWALEVTLRRQAGVTLAEDMAALRLARVLSRRGVQVGMPEAASAPSDAIGARSAPGEVR